MASWNKIEKNEDLDEMKQHSPDEHSPDIEILNVANTKPNPTNTTKNHMKVYFTDNEWEKLFVERPNLFEERKKILNEFVEMYFADIYGAAVEYHPEQGDCIPLCILYFEHGGNYFFLSDEYVSMFRSDLGDYMQQNISNYKITPNEIKTYKKNGRLLDERHLHAYHKMSKTNIVIFEYEEKHKSHSQQLFYNAQYSKCMFMSYVKTLRGHYNTLRIGPNKYMFPMEEINKYEMDKDKTYYFIKPQPNMYSTLTDMNLLESFDMRNKIKHILTTNVDDRYKIVNVFGKCLYEKISFLGNATLLRCITDFKWTSQSFRNNDIDSSVNIIMDQLLN
eukprot:52329_1